MTEITFVDTTLRDGNSSLWAYMMRTEMMLPVAETIDNAGFEGMELMASAPFKKCVRELREDPWERLRQVRQRVCKTPLRVIRGRYMSAFHIMPQVIEELCTERLAANGIRAARISDPSNRVSTWRDQARKARETGMQTIINLIYTVSPKHTDYYYAEKARAAAALDIDRICLKDPGGLITPERIRSLVPIVLANASGKPVEFHTHCITGLGPLCCLEVIKLGITCINTAIPPLANASSNPSLFNVIRNARALGYTSTVNEDDLRPVETHFTTIAKREGLPIGAPAEYDHAQFLHQVPGGMISNFRFQLSKLGMQHRLGAVLEETARVRAEFGYPIMVTPYSQFVGTQAAMNVILGERYKTCSDEVILYALGFWGEEECSSIEPNIRDRILNRLRARELAKWQPPEPTLHQVRQQHGWPGISDDDLLLCYFAGRGELETMRAGRAAASRASAPSPIRSLMDELNKARHCTYIHISKGAMSLTLKKAPANGARKEAHA